VVKPGAFDPVILERTPLPGSLITHDRNSEHTVIPDIGWMEGINSTKNLTFAGFRPDSTSFRFCLVITCDPASDRLVLLPLQEGETPLTVLSDQKRRHELERIVTALKTTSQNYSEKKECFSLSLRRTIAEKKIGPPLPKPGRIFAVAANFPSHIRTDLAIKDPAALETLGETRPRVFLKYPPTPLPGPSRTESTTFTGIKGPYDGIDYPSHILLPAVDKKQTQTETRLDYEVEIGVVIGRVLSRDALEKADDEAIRSAIAGYILVSDTKARNPQVVQRIISHSRSYPKNPNPYLSGNEANDRAVGLWNSETCTWWSYAASWGNYASLGPFFVSSPADLSFPARALISARSYGASSARPVKPPGNSNDGMLYLRQCSITTEENGYQDKLIWSIPQIIRSILEPNSALAFTEGKPCLEPGDIICLGTPGGTVITGKSGRMVSLLRKVLFWWDSLDWHDAFFDKSAGLYLHDGDEVFFWAEGLGFQHQEIRRVEIE